MNKTISSFKEYLEYRKLGFSLPYDNLTKSYPLLNGDRITLESLYEDYRIYMNSANKPIKFLF